MNNKMSQNSTMLFIGNGFDQVLGHKTSYSDFYKSDYFKGLLQRGNGLCTHINKHFESSPDENKWSDLENGLYDYSRTLSQTIGEGNTEVAETFKREFEDLKQSLFDYLSDIQGGGVPFGGRSRLLLNWRKLDPVIVTFNYTISLLAELQDEIYINNKNKLIPLHGLVNDISNCRTNTSSDIILGIDESQKVEELHSFLYKSRQRKDDIRQLQQLINNQNNYIVFGCSMGMSDATYFRMLFGKQQLNKRYLIYGKDTKSIDEIKKNISNYVDDCPDFYNRNEVVFLKTEECESCASETMCFVDKIVSGE